MNVANQEAFALNRIPLLDFALFHDTCRSLLALGARIISWTPHPENPAAILAIFAEKGVPWLTVLSGSPPDKRYPSLSADFPQMHYFECELLENEGFVPENHPWIRPVRSSSGIQAHPMYQVKGTQIHEVAVGPVHAGIIEPGHFRFQCHGETVLHLEMTFGFQHRGIEELIRSSKLSGHMPLIESTAGDSVIANAVGYAESMEALAGIEIPDQTDALRAAALELERIAMHLSSLAGICADIGFAIGSSLFGALRTSVINTTAAICGSRFGRGWVIPGGMRFPISADGLAILVDTLQQVRTKARRAQRLLFASTGAVARMEGTASISTAQADELGLVGPVARASGIAMDIRADYPSGIYNRIGLAPATRHRGDVYARTWVRCAEIESSIRGLLDMIETTVLAIQTSQKPQTLALRPRHAVASLVEGFRGRITHFAATDRAGHISAYRITDPSFHNWYGLGLAMRGQQIFDFPLANKSFDLSYCGHDL